MSQSDLYLIGNGKLVKSDKRKTLMKKNILMILHEIFFWKNILIDSVEKYNYY
jgi:hypothetical protein